MSSLPADPSLLAVACPRCHAAIAVPLALFGQAAACPICTGGFMAPRPALSNDPPLPAASPRTGPPETGRAVPPELQPLDTSEPQPQTIRRGAESIELRRLTPEEKAARRVRRTIVTIGAGTAILFAIVLVATRGGGKPKRKRR